MRRREKRKKKKKKKRKKKKERKKKNIHRCLNAVSILLSIQYDQSIQYNVRGENSLFSRYSFFLLLTKKKTRTI